MESVQDFARQGFFGPDLRELLLCHGKECQRRDENLPQAWRELLGPKKMCFQTCSEFALQYPDDLLYVEGYAFADIPLRYPLPHAWLLTKDNLVVDPTWQSGSGYFGIVFQTNQLREYLLLSGEYGVLQSLWYQREMREAFLADCKHKTSHPVAEG